MAVMEQDRFWFRGAGRCSKSWSNVRPATCGADAPRVSSGASCWMVAVSFLAAFRTCPAGLVVGHVRRQEDRGDALQQPAGPVEAGQGFRVVGAGVVRDDRDLAGLGFALEPVQREGRPPGVPVLLDRVRRDCSAGRGRASEKDWDVLRRSTDRPGALPFRGLHAAGPGLVLQAAGPGWPRVPASGRGRVPPRPGSPHARPGPSTSWCPATRPAVPAPSSPPARPSQR